MADIQYIDSKYYEAVPARSISEQVAVAARNRIYADFLRICRPGPDDTILDVGVSDVANDAANMLEQRYPYRQKLTAVGLGHPEKFREACPDIEYRQVVPNQKLPFDDKSFDIAVSNAVLEHVGSHENQLFFVRELCRVANRVFLTVPHKYFPVEHHTAIPLLHFWKGTFGPACRLLNRAVWSDEQNLILMTRSRLALLARSLGTATIGYTGIRLGPFSSNLFLHLHGLPVERNIGGGQGS
jgi:hypothetical protein